MFLLNTTRLLIDGLRICLGIFLINSVCPRNKYDAMFKVRKIVCVCL